MVSMSKSSEPFPLLSLRDHDCFLVILSFLNWEDLNSFSLVSKQCYETRNHSSLDQTRSGTISLGTRVSNAMQLMQVSREKQWPTIFSGKRKHLRLFGLHHLSTDIDAFDNDFVDNASPLTGVTTLDCSVDRKRVHRPGLAKFENYIDTGLTHGFTLSLLFPNLVEMDMSYLPLTLLGVAWILENNSKLKVLRWNHAVIWPINADTCELLKACTNLKELYLDSARMLFCDIHGTDYLWESLSEYGVHLEKVSLRGARKCHLGKLSALSQESLMKFVRHAPSLKWFRSGLTPENVATLKKEFPHITFCD